MRYVFHPTQKITKNDNGTLIVVFHADGLREMAWILIEFLVQLIRSLLWIHKQCFIQSINFKVGDVNIGQVFS